MTDRLRNIYTGEVVIRLGGESTPTITKYHNEGGGFVRAMATIQFDQLFVPHDAPPKIVRAVIGGDFIEAVFFAYMSERRWNGWAVPYFTAEQAAELARIFGGDACFEDVDGVMVFSYRDENDDVRVEVWPEVVDTVDGPRTLYQIGDGWCWSCFNSTVVDYVSGA